MATSTVNADIEKSKKNESVSVQLTDGKIVCNFSLNMDKESEYGRWHTYQKVFDSWKEFTDYSKDFFTT